MSAQWDRRVRLGDVFHDGNLNLSIKASHIVKRMRRATSDDYLWDLLDELQDVADADDVSEFDQVWDAIYDWADQNRIWIDTFARADQ